MSSQPQAKASEASARPESPPVPDDSFWNDDAGSDNSAWLASLAAPSPDEPTSLRSVPLPAVDDSEAEFGPDGESVDAAPDLDAMFAAASTAVTESPDTDEERASATAPAPRPASPFAAVNDWVEPVEIEPVAAAAPPAGYEPTPIPVPVFEVVEPPAPTPAPVPIATAPVTPAPVPAPVAAAPAAPVPVPLEPVPATPAPSPFATSFEADDTVVRDVMFTPVPTLAPTPAPDPAPTAKSSDPQHADPYAWMDLDGIDDLLPPA